MEVLRLLGALALAFAILILVMRFILPSSVGRSPSLQLGIGAAVGVLGALAVLALRFDLLSEETESLLVPIVIIVGSTLVAIAIVFRTANRFRRW
jgi:hypothetical protein